MENKEDLITTQDVFCTSCGTKNEKESKFCFNCGHELKKDINSVKGKDGTEKKKGFKDIIILLILLIALFALFLGQLGIFEILFVAFLVLIFYSLRANNIFQIIEKIVSFIVVFMLIMIGTCLIPIFFSS